MPDSICFSALHINTAPASSYCADHHILNEVFMLWCCCLSCNVFTNQVGTQMGLSDIHCLKSRTWCRSMIPMNFFIRSVTPVWFDVTLCRGLYSVTKLLWRWACQIIVDWISVTSLRLIIPYHVIMSSLTFVCYDSVAYLANMLKHQVSRQMSGAAFIDQLAIT